MEEVQRFLDQVIVPKIKNGRYELITDFKTELQEYLQQNGTVHIRYELIKEEGPSHDKVFTVQVTVDGKKYKTASGKTKKGSRANGREIDYGRTNTEFTFIERKD